MKLGTVSEAWDIVQGAFCQQIKLYSTLFKNESRKQLTTKKEKKKKNKEKKETALMAQGNICSVCKYNFTSKLTGNIFEPGWRHHMAQWYQRGTPSGCWQQQQY